MQINKKDNIIKSPLNFTGGKYKLLPQLFPLFPNDIHTFVDLFCGGCNVGINISAPKIICNDKDKKLIGLFSFFQKISFDDLFLKVKNVIFDFNLSDSSLNGYSFYNCDSSKGLGEFNKKGFNLLKEKLNHSNDETDDYFIMMYVLIIYAFNNQIRFNSAGEFNLPVGKRDFNIKMQNKINVFLQVLKNKNVCFLNKDFAQFNAKMLTRNDFVYADPPYLIACAPYNEKLWNEREERRLLAYLDELTSHNIRFALSNVLSMDNRVNKILTDWLKKNKNYFCHHLKFSYNNSNYQKKIAGKADEVLITNY